MDVRISKILNAIKEEKVAEDERIVELTDRSFSAKQLQRAGKGLSNVTVRSLRSGVFGRMIITIGASHGDALAQVDFGHGDPVVVRCKDEKYSGFVFSTNQLTWDICIDTGDQELKNEQIMSKSFDILPSSNDITYRRMKNAANDLLKLNTQKNQSLSRLLKVIFENGNIRPSEPVTNLKYTTLNTNPSGLNQEQKRALVESIKNVELFCLHGPPGTGKTTTISNIISEFAARKMKILVTCPSNAAVDVLVEKCIHKKIRVIRLGHPVRTSQHLRQWTLDAHLNESEVLTDLKKEIKTAQGRERGELRKELRQREQKICKEKLEATTVIVGTCTVVGFGSILDVLEPNHFDIAIVDEAGQATEPAIYPTLVRCPNRLILAGDPHQLPPTVISENKTLSFTLLEKLMKYYPENVVMLKTQYRMNKIISDWVSKSMYQNQLEAAPMVENHTLAQLTNASFNDKFDKELLQNPIIFIDTAGEMMNEEIQNDEDSKSNRGEAAIITFLVNRLLKTGISIDQIAVISPYAAQVQLINQMLNSKVSCRSVDGYQGGEAEVVLLSLVRSNSEASCGFLSDNRRLNVAVSRARRCCIVVADSETVCSVPFIEDMVTYFCDKGHILSLSQIQTEEEWSQCATDAGYEETQVAVTLPTEQIEPTEDPKFSSQPKKSESQTVTPNTGPKKPPKSQKKSKLEKKLEKLALEKQKEVTEAETDTNYVESQTNFEKAEIKHTKKFENLEVEENQGKVAVGYIICDQCKKHLPEANMELHLVHCARLMKQAEELSKAQLNQPKQTNQKAKKVKKNKPNVKKNPRNKDFDDIEDEDELLAKAMATAGHCAQGVCKISVRVLGFTCATCSKVFCNTHKFPESHGCRASAMKQVAGRSQQIKQSQLKNKLTTKINDLESTRNTKSKSKKN